MQTIVFTGDSHTWGEGAAPKSPPDYFGDGSGFVAGELRRMRTDYPSFVSLIAAKLARRCNVVNSGIGSCPTFRYLSEYWADYVEAHKPAVIVIQPHTINDWLTGEGATAYGAHLTAYAEKAKATAPKVLLTSVSAILGPQTISSCPDTYGDYIAEIYKVGKALNIPVADVFPALQDKALFADSWHVNIAGHRIYAEIIWEKLAPML